MTPDEICWLGICKSFPQKYRIDVDNDCVFISDLDANEDVFIFNHYGWEFALDLLRYIGCNAEPV